MKKLNEGVTANQSNPNLENKVVVCNNKMESINFWRAKEENRRKYIALNSESHENDICPICGRSIKGDESSNGMPLVNALVCYKCDKRYVYPYRLRSSQLKEKELANASWQNYLIFMQAELMIAMTNQIKSLVTNQSDLI